MTFYTSFLYFIKIYCHSSTDASIQHFCYHTYPIQIRVQPYLESIKRKKKMIFLFYTDTASLIGHQKKRRI